MPNLHILNIQSTHLTGYLDDQSLKDSDFIKHSGIPKPTASRILSVMKEKNILSEIMPARGRRSSTFAYTRLVNIADGYDVFVSHERQNMRHKVFLAKIVFDKDGFLCYY
ncbi:hypothetical protein MBAV_001393 [Candidatus Magnetobacterium bavaricum]|uniref:Uncharacterized protein n=1 Tax=Candidatus Magnetobacterium bavaricum TaxID=29290 RepID=A0A0F3H0H0_9BACT|nr:hypothetical protein MBAV_001393 [Candidatus Magnetobacterium bavaricum]